MVPSQLPKQDALNTNTTSATRQVVQQSEDRQEATVLTAGSSTSTTRVINQATAPTQLGSKTTAQLGSSSQGVKVATDAGQGQLLWEATQQEAAQTQTSTCTTSAQQIYRGQQLLTAAADIGNAANADACMRGFLERVPASWLHLFIRSLPAASKQSLLAGNTWLATKVLEASANVKLLLLECVPIELPYDHLTPEETEMRRSILTQLLSARREFEVELFPAAWQPFPTQLASRVVSLTANELDNPNASPVSASCSWGAMPCLHTAVITECDITKLCEAVEAGQLPQLRRLSVWNTNSGFCFYEDGPDAERWVCALRTQLEVLHIAAGGLVQYAPQFTMLKGLALQYCTLTADVMKQLCEHPTLRHLTLYLCKVQDDCRSLHCSWETLVLWDMCLCQLPDLPLADVPHIHLLRAVDLTPSDDSQAISACLAEHLDKITCTPFFSISPKSWETPEFSITHSCADTVVLLKHMHGVETLSLHDGDWLSILPQLWKVLPQSITCLSFYTIQTSDSSQWVQLWDGFPQHVARVTIYSSNVTLDALETLVRKAPEHVHVLEVDMGDAYPPAWKDQLRAVAPKHLTVKTFCWPGRWPWTMDMDWSD